MKRISKKGAFIDKTITSDNVISTNNSPYITQIDGDASYTPITESDSSGYLWTPAQEQKIQFSLNEPYSIMMNGWLVMNPDNISEYLTISVNDRPMFHSDLDGNVSFQILVKEGDTITSTATSSRSAYFMPCMSELEDWRDNSLKRDYDIWKNAIRVEEDGTINVVDQYLNSPDEWARAVKNGLEDEGLSDRKIKEIKLDEGFNANGEHLFYIQTENLTNSEGMFDSSTPLQSFNGDLSNLTNGSYMFDGCSTLESFSGNLSNLTNGSYMFRRTALTSFNGDMPKLTNGSNMFNSSTIKSFNGDLSSLIYGDSMFGGCESLTSFSGDLSNLTRGILMFENTPLESFSGDLSSLAEGHYMFDGCKLNLESIQNIANTINTVSSGIIHIGIQSSLQGNTDLSTAMTTIEHKGWRITAEYN